MRSAVVGAFTLAAGLALIGISAAPASRANAQEAGVAVFFGFIAADATSGPPQSVRATIADITCGTSDVTPLDDGVAFYLLTVASASEKAGCGVDGAPVTFLLLFGEVDPGSPAAQTQAWGIGAHRLDLSAATDVAFGRFVGEFPAGPGIAMLRWSGASATPTEQAVATIARDVESVSHFDVPSQSFRTYIPGAPALASDYALIDRDDIVAVRVR